MDTITAIATPMGSGGIGIVKLTGKNAIEIAETIFQSAKNTSAKNSPRFFAGKKTEESHRLFYGHIVDPESKQVIDEVLLSIMRAPHSYTREDVVEINAHSGIVVLRSILNLVLKQGARLAGPGEFTKRAYLNGRIDLTQAEAVMDLINAKSLKSLEIAFSQLKGELKERIQSIRESLVSILTEIEAAIDFPDDIKDINLSDNALFMQLARAQTQIKQLIDQYNSGQVLREGLKLSIVGKPNVGKSSLLNRLLQNDRAIVTDVPGTTRDIIEETVVIDGLPIVISDTAGLHRADNKIEAIGIDRTRMHIMASDVILFLVEAGSPLTKEDFDVYQQMRGKQKILVVNKMDLIDNKRGVEKPPEWEALKTAEISALYNKGIEELKHLIVTVCNEEFPFDNQDTIVPNLRQTLSLKKGLEATSTATEGIRKSIPTELIALDIKDAIQALDEIIGLNVQDEILERIFSQFCIGK